VLTKAEQETVVRDDRDDPLVYIYTANPTNIRRAKADSRFTLVREDAESAQFTIPRVQFNILGGLKRRRKPMDEAQRKAAGERLAKGRGK